MSRVLFSAPEAEAAQVTSIPVVSDILWDKIVSIDYVSYEQVYDIEVEGTHNFVANGIIAHNTYISSNVGIGTTAPGAALEVVGKLKVSTQGFQSAGANAVGVTKRVSTIIGDTGASGVGVTTTLVTITDDGYYDIMGFIYSGRNSEGGGMFPFVARRSNPYGTRTVSVGSAIAGSATTAPTMAWSGDNLQVTHAAYHYGFVEMALEISSAPTTVTWGSVMGG